MAHSGFENVAIQQISIRYVILGAAVIGTLQASTWIVLSLISILYYNSVIQISDDLSEKDYSFWIYTFYLQKNIKIENFFIHPISFNIFMYFYMVLSLIWLIISCYILWAMIRDKWYHVKLSMVAWAGITLTIAALDIILMSLIAADLQTAHDWFKIPTITTTAATTTTTTIFTTISTAMPSSVSETASSEIVTLPSSVSETASSEFVTLPSSVTESALPSEDTSEVDMLKYFISSTLGLMETRNIVIDPSLVNTIYTAMGIIMSSAARGYILWIVNVVCASIFIRLVYKMNEQSLDTALCILIWHLASLYIVMRRHNFLQEKKSMLPIIDAYATGERPFNLYDSTDISTGNWNNGFQPDESIIFSPSRRNPLGNNNEDTTPQDYDIFSPYGAPAGSHMRPAGSPMRPAGSPMRPASSPMRPAGSPMRPASSPMRPAGSPMRPVSSLVSRPAEASGPRLAKIGKSTPGRRTPPQSVPVPHVPQGPYIPPPDYTPPGSPMAKPRSVLRPQSNYVL